ncbi:MAG: hypothetical protein LC808_10800, partial [Actinobacteria bacterium]|nr:hypothetical protein [Actinomycetota bacterium]
LGGIDDERCARAIESQLLVGYRVKQPHTKFPVFAFRLHQFISRGDTVYSTIEAEAGRKLTLEPQRFAPGDATKLLVPMAFCRECGQEYCSVRLLEDGSSRRVDRAHPCEVWRLLATTVSSRSALLQNTTPPGWELSGSGVRG